MSNNFKPSKPGTNRVDTKAKKQRPLFIRTYQPFGANWQFELCAPNGEALLTSEAYTTKRAMNRAIELVLTTGIDPTPRPGKPNTEM